MKKGIVLLVVAGIALLAAGSLRAEDLVRLGPKVYQRTDASPNVYSEQFQARAGVARIIIHNGGVDGLDPVSSAVVSINGDQVFGPKDFGNNVLYLEREISLSGSNTLSVDLRSKPNTYLLITIVQKPDYLLLFKETFETSPIGAIPLGWTPACWGQLISVTGDRALEGTQSLVMRGVPFGGANLDYYLQGIALTSGKYRFAFYMFIDSANWIGGDGKAIGHLETGGFCYAMGVAKVYGQYMLDLYGAPERYISFPVSLDTWVKYELIIDADTHQVDLFVGGTPAGSTTADIDGRGVEAIQLAAGAAGPPGGHPSVYYDLVTIEKIW